MSRIRKAYEAKCRPLLRHVRARRLEEGVLVAGWVLAADERAGGHPFTQALALHP